MKKFQLLTVAGAMLTAFWACDGGKKQQQVQVEEEVVEDTVVDDNPYKDHTIYGLCGNGSAMNTLQLLTDVGDTLNLSVAEAQENGKVFGEYAEGDRMAVLTDRTKQKATIVINQSGLLGNWVTINPLDGTSEYGICLKEGGIAEGIEQSSLSYKTWRIFNGKLEIMAMREGGGDVEETGLYEILKLEPDSLVFRDAEETFRYGRQKPHEEYKNIQLEESSMDDFKM